MNITTRLFDFIITTRENNEISDSNEIDETSSDSDNEENKKYTDRDLFTVQMFGINTQGKTCSIIANGFRPFFYVKIPDTWKSPHIKKFVEHIKEKIGNYYKDSLVDYKHVTKKTLYWFDNDTKYNFVMLIFSSIRAFNKAKNLWFYYSQDENGKNRSKLKKNGYSEPPYKNDNLKIFESNIPPLLRLFHIRDISPSGWVKMSTKHLSTVDRRLKKTSCDNEYEINYKYIKPDNEREDSVPYKICSFDIEASSSHGDFPLPVKTYKKLAMSIVNNIHLIPTVREDYVLYVRNAVLTAFSHAGNNSIDNVETVYTKRKALTKPAVLKLIEKLILTPIDTNGNNSDIITIEDSFINAQNEINNEYDQSDFNGDLYDEVGYGYNTSKKYMKKKCKSSMSNADTIVDLLLNSKIEKDEKIELIRTTLDKIFPPLEGDKVTFIGSTFMRYGESKTYLNHCLALGDCNQVSEIPNSFIDCCKTEKELLLKWAALIREENPDILIGYNIHGFDFKFMYSRAEENGKDCLDNFLLMSRNNNEICAERDFKTGKLSMNTSSIVLASGQHDLHYIKMPGRLQFDLYNFFRKEHNLPSYKLDYVSKHFIGDKVGGIENCDGDMEQKQTIIYTKNMTGIELGSYISFEIISHSTDIYRDGAKFKIIQIDKENRNFIIVNSLDKMGNSIGDDLSQYKKENKVIRWCLAKDDVTPQDIFRLSAGGPDDRALVAKYCIQDCNIPHELMIKNDIITTFIEMSKLCSVPIDFLATRGQGIKLTSFVFKECRKRDTLLPVLEKGKNEGYEGAIVLDPKCKLYLEEPVACVDYSSLYPSSMWSENLSHDSKVWTKEYDLNGELVKFSGDLKYDNLNGFDYVDIDFNLYEWKRKTPKAAATKHIKGTKTCRFVQFKGDKLGILPTILRELLAARKATRRMIKTEKDDFMKNVLDKRQLAIKVTANSVYGQCGAKTSTFYEPDVAASTTATGRKLLVYGKTVIEETYKNRRCMVKYINPDYAGSVVPKGIKPKADAGQIAQYIEREVLTTAEYVYGDTDSVFFKFNLTDPKTGEKIKNQEAVAITIELAREAGEIATKFLKPPHDLEYENVKYPLLLLSKKRYVADLYEDDPSYGVGKRKNMGVVLKRRDNPDIVKDIYGGVIDILMNQKDIVAAIHFLKKRLQNIVDKKVNMDKLIISKALRGHYKNPQQIAHWVLANRIGKRDPGNKPSIGDRISYAYINNKDKKALQGDRIETPEYIKSNNLEIDYSHYILNCVLKPVQQIFALLLEEIPEFRKDLKHFEKQIRCLKRKYHDKSELGGTKYLTEETKIRNREVKRLLFDNYLRQTDNINNGNKTIHSFFK